MSSYANSLRFAISRNFLNSHCENAALIKQEGKEDLFYGFELGNEVWGIKTGDAHFTPAQAAKDYALLRKELDEIFGEGKMKILTLSGNWEYVFMTEFIEKFSDWDGVAWHWYPLGAGRSDEVIPNVNDENFTLTEIRERLELVNLWQRQHGRDKELWMGETGGAFNSGQNTTTNRFMSHRWYLDQLGIFAQYRHDAYCRQTLIGGNYGLLQRSEKVNAINPDFWGTVLFNSLMGRYVHEVKHSGDEKLHIYAHKNDENQFVLLAINFNREKSVQIEAINGLADLHVVVWEMTSPDDQSSTVILNGNELPKANTVDITEMWEAKNLPVKIAAKSYAFIRVVLN
ncbi:unnamed protein product [Oikopleura dioica]|uniref:Uncharacterized protein n=1 Tax=Oikopleura dioica TaxID=34765 RepID=E4XSB1_OIKDI|nr:unnamed protein product [Oikopleura dioica]